MEDQVPFKIFTYWSQKGKPEVRRFGIDKSLVTSFVYLNAKLQEIFPGLTRKTYSVTWKDDEGDDVTLSSDEEVMTALTSMRGDLIKLNIYCNDDEPKEVDCDIVITTVPESTGTANAIHYGVMCDNCDTAIVGFRYKCTICDDYDLCSKCESIGKHPDHCMVRVPTPSMPRAYIRAAIKRSRHFLKTVASANAEECPYKKHRRERSAEKKRRGEDHDNSHGGEHHRGDRHHRRPRTSWIETFATYMNEFANLAGDIQLNTDEKTAGSSKQQPESQSQQQATSADSTEAPKADASQPKPSTSTRNTECPFQGGINVVNIQKLLDMYLNGNMPQGTPQASSNDASVNTSVPTNNASVNTNDVEMGQGDGTPSEADKVSIKSESSSSSSSASSVKRDDSPDKGDGWTMINKEKDLMDTYMKPSAPVETSTPIGFNLPEQFQEHVKISEGQKLYPPLHTAAAVLNPKEVDQNVRQQQAEPRPASSAQQVPSQEQATPPQPKPPQQQPRIRHPKPHIDAAIEQMLAMGFTNDGGWLTQLLESKDGNIAAVLDLLTPVSPKNK